MTYNTNVEFPNGTILTCDEDMTFIHIQGEDCSLTFKQSDWAQYPRETMHQIVAALLGDFNTSEPSTTEAKFNEDTERVISLDTGYQMRAPARDSSCDYVRFVNKNKNEVVYWHWNEWQEDPEVCMGAIVGAMISVEDFDDEAE